MVDSNCSHVKLFVSVDEDQKLTGKDENCTRAMGLQMFCFFKNFCSLSACLFNWEKKRI